MRIYYPHLQAIDQQTKQLEKESCHHCQRTRQLVSHGFIYKKCGMGAEPEIVGKRVLCSNSNRHTGWGRTLELYSDCTVRSVHDTGRPVLACGWVVVVGCGGAAEAGHEGGKKGSVNCTCGILLRQHGEDGLAHQENPLDVHVVDEVPSVFRKVFDQVVTSDARVIDQHVDTAV